MSLPSNHTSERLRRSVVLSTFVAMAYALSAAAHFLMLPIVPAVPFLKYDPKDVVIAVGGFLFGPLSGALVAFLTALIETFTISETGIIGTIMNVISSACFVCPAAWWYRKRRTLSAAFTGLLFGALVTLAVMLLWNYFLTPLYMGIPRDAVVDLLPWIMLFNLLKISANAALTLLLYKPLRTALTKARLMPTRDTTSPRRRPIGMWIACGLVLVTCIGVVLTLTGLW